MNDTPTLPNAPVNQQWGGRFAAGPSAIMQEINTSIGFDQTLWRQDIRGSLAHAAMLAKVGVIGAADEQAIRTGLAEIRSRCPMSGTDGQSRRGRRWSDGTG